MNTTVTNAGGHAWRKCDVRLGLISNDKLYSNTGRSHVPCAFQSTPILALPSADRIGMRTSDKSLINSTRFASYSG
jgi:hypothetical protein